MNKNQKIIVICSSVILVLVFFFPIWKINLEAPQYPEGIGLEIWLNKITGQKPNDLNSINGLNHYIGMKPINPSDIPELKLMPYIIMVMILLGLAAGILGKKSLVKMWIALFFVIGIVGMYDFYQWEYDYGHDLNPHAAIKIPGMSYQPPLIGSQKLLNFNAISMPDIGTWIIILSVLLSVLALMMNKKLIKAEVKNEIADKNIHSVTAATLGNS